jgi:hypothetical protein
MTFFQLTNHLQPGYSSPNPFPLQAAALTHSYNLPVRSHVLLHSNCIRSKANTRTKQPFHTSCKPIPPPLPVISRKGIHSDWNFFYEYATRSECRKETKNEFRAAHQPTNPPVLTVTTSDKGGSN